MTKITYKTHENDMAKLRKAALEFLEGGYAVHLSNCRYDSWDGLGSFDCKLFTRQRRLARVLGVKLEPPQKSA